MNEIQVFKNTEFGEVRTVELDNEVWLVGKDVAGILGYSRPDHALTAHVDDDDKLMYQISTSGQNRNMYVINESGLYSLVLSSKMPYAKKFRRWITSEVLPSIRKHGAYMTPETLEKALLSPNFLIQIGVKLKEEQKKRQQLEALAIEQEKTIEMQYADIQRMKPKEQFADAVADSKDTILIRDLAKLLKQNGVKTGEKRLYAWLRNNGYICKSSTKPTQNAMNLGLFIVKESVRILPSGESRTDLTTKVTGKGQQYFLEKGLKLKVMDGEH